MVQCDLSQKLALDDVPEGGELTRRETLKAALAEKKIGSFSLFKYHCVPDADRPEGIKNYWVIENYLRNPRYRELPAEHYDYLLKKIEAVPSPVAKMPRRPRCSNDSVKLHEAPEDGQYMTRREILQDAFRTYGIGSVKLFKEHCLNDPEKPSDLSNHFRIENYLRSDTARHIPESHYHYLLEKMARLELTACVESFMAAAGVYEAFEQDGPEWPFFEESLADFDGKNHCVI